MESSTANPIYERLTRGEKGPSARAARWIGVGMGATLGLLTFAILYGSSASLALSATVLGIEAALAVLTPPVGLIAAAGLSGRYAAEEDFALLRLSGLSTEDIGEGYAEAVVYRLRVLRAVAVWSPGAWIIMVIVITMIAEGIDSVSVLVILFIAGIATVLGYHMSRSCIRLGVWIGLRWARHATVIAAVGSIGALTIFSLVVILSVSQIGSPRMFYSVLFVLFVLPFLMSALEDALRKGVESFIEGRNGARNPPPDAA